MRTATPSRRRRLARNALPALTLGLLALALSATGTARAANVIVSLTANGPQPNPVTLLVSDTVTFVNNDTENHSIVSSTGAFTSPVITPGQSWTLSIGKSGKLDYQQTGFSHHNFHGTIQVSAAPANATLTLSASRTSIRFGLPVVLSGHADLQPGASILLVQHNGGPGGRTSNRCGSRNRKSGSPTGTSGWTQIGAPIPIGADGSFTLSVRPTQGSVYRATSADGQVCSQPLLVTVMPVLTIRAQATATKAGHSVVITARIAPAGAFTSLTLSWFDPVRGQWKKLATGSTSAAGIARFAFTPAYGVNRLRAEAGGRTGGHAGGRSLFQPATSSTLSIRGIGAPPAPVQQRRKRR